jgi:hypothetical protein
MNYPEWDCPEWEERVAAGDPKADGLARDARLLQTLPPEAFVVDYAAIRAAARKGAVQRRMRSKLLAALAVAVAAAVLLTVKLPLYRRPPAPLAKVSAPPPIFEMPHAEPTASSALPKLHPRRPRSPHADLDRKFADFLRAQYELRHPAPPRSSEIATGNPNVTILLLQESKGDTNE